MSHLWVIWGGTSYFNDSLKEIHKNLQMEDQLDKLKNFAFKAH